MSIASLLPVRISLFDRTPRKPKHSAPVEVDRLRHLLNGAHQLIAGLHLRLADLEHQHREVVARIDERHGEIVRGLEAQVARLERRLEISVLAEAVVTETQEIDVRALQERLAEGPVRTLNQSPQARRNPGHVPGWVKDQPEPAA